MLAAMFTGLENIEVTEVPTPTPGPGEMVIRVKSCAVCGSDVRIFHHGNTRVKPPQIIGHEVAGEVVEVGADVAKFKAGDRVALGADVPCGRCQWCRGGMGNNCDTNFAIGYQFQGGFAEYMLVNKTTLDYGPVHHIPEGLSFDEASIAEPLGCVLNGLELAFLGVGDALCIIGGGPVGCMMIELGRHMGATNISIVDLSDKRLDLARQFRADHYINASKCDVVEAVREATGGEGPDVVMTPCGAVQAHSQAIEMVRHRGRVNLFGGLPKTAPPLTVPSNLIHYKECYVLGSHGSVPRQHKAALGLLARGMVTGSKYLTHQFPLSDIKEAFETAEACVGLKVMVNP